MAFYCSVIATFHTILFARWDVLSVMIAALAVEAATFYLVLSGTGFITTELVQGIMTKLEEVLPKWVDRNKAEMRYWKAKLKSFRPLRIQEGEFDTLSRDKVLVFIDFYVQKVIALTLTYRS